MVTPRGAALPADNVSSEGGTWAPGVTVGHYSLLAKLAVGGMAEIWLARQSGLRGFERIVVVKRIIESLSADESFVEMFLDEARIIVQLTHPNIVQVFDLGEHAGAYYIAMEYLAGENLATVARYAAKAGKQLEPETAVKLIISALEGLAHAHTRTGVDGRPLNVVHRDVSPQNIVLTWEGQIKLVDFGIARATNRATQTQGQQLKGKFAYMAPEQAEGTMELDGRADVFAMGIVLWEMITHRRLYPNEDSVQILKSLIGPSPVQSAVSKNPKVPQDLSEIVGKALEKDVDARYPDAQSFKHALEEWLRPRGGGPTAAQLGEMMHTLFAARIAERKDLIENAARGVASASKVGEALKPTTNRTMPGQTSFLSMNGKLIAALVAMLVLLGFVGVLTWKAFSQPVAPEMVATEITPSDEPVVTPSSIVVETDPVGATITLDGKKKGVSPLTLSESKAGEHVIEATLAGRVSVKKTVTVKAEGEQLMMVLSLPAVQVAQAPTNPQPNDTPKVPVEVKRPEVPRNGKLSLNTDPWTHVSLNGKMLGDTPLIEFALPAGRHRLQLTNEKEKIDLAIEVEVKPGQTTKKVLKL
ncbi:MAG: serine/threonine protein kinase [Archangium sp.]|nr:serine/threonine protein kinase [Archangium sp.]